MTTKEDVERQFDELIRHVPLQPARGFDVGAFDRMRALGVVPDYVKWDSIPILGNSELVSFLSATLSATEHLPEVRRELVEKFREILAQPAE
jgi:hypothetical protein